MMTDPIGEFELGRGAARRILQQEAYRRVLAGNLPQTLSDFAAQLSAWCSAAHPALPTPRESFVEDAIRDIWQRRHEIIGSEL